MTEKTRNDGTKKTPSYSKYILTLIFIAIAAILYYFWAVPYRAALSYREQLQLFQTTDAYFTELIGRPAGGASYIGTFLTQFFNNYWAGAAVMSGMLTLSLLFFYLIVRKYSSTLSKFSALAISLIPIISLFLFLGNPDVTMNYITAIVLVVAAVSVFVCGDSGKEETGKEAAAEYVMISVFTPLLYWLCGPATLIFTLLAIFYVGAKSSRSIAYKSIFALTASGLLTASFLIWTFTLPYPVSYQLIGIGYVMMPDKLYAGQVAVEALCVVVPVAAILIAHLSQKIVIPSLIALEVAALIIFFPKSYDQATYRLIDYDYMVRANDWEGILSYSGEHDPDLPLSVSATNLAAGMSGTLDAIAFNFRQHGSEGLIPPFVKETLSSWTTGEIFFQLGMINSAQRFCFEGMEAIPNYNKSSRAIRRLAETAIIRGDYKLAEKYLIMLTNTMFYKKWAQRNLELIKDPGAVESHPLYGTLRKRMIDESYLFSEGELDKTFGQLLMKDPGNNLAKQYLILYPLLQRDLNKFAQYMGVVAEYHPGYNPLLAQQALAFMSMKNGQPIPAGAVGAAVKNSLRDFAKAWTSKNPSFIEPYRRTLYHYLLSEE